MPRLSKRDRSQLAQDILARSWTDSELGRRYRVHRSSVLRLRRFLDSLNQVHPDATNATGPQKHDSSKVEQVDSSRTQQGMNAPNNPSESAQGTPPPVRPQQENSQGGQ